MVDSCSTCFRPLTGRVQDQVVHGCCQRRVCSQCTARNVRLATYCPFCDDAVSALRKRRADVLKAGDTLFDLTSAEEQDMLVQSAQKGGNTTLTCSAPELPSLTPTPLDPPPAYSSAPKFSLEDESDTLTEAPAPSGSKLEPAVPSDQLPEGKEAQDPDASESAPALVRYYLQPHDTVAGIALKFRCSRTEVCAINGLPRTAVHTPSVLHTRRYVDLPSGSLARGEEGLPAYSDRPPPLPETFTPSLEPATLKHAAQVRFQALVLCHPRAEAGALLPDARAAEAYVSLAQAELAETGMLQVDPPALVNLAVSHWMMDSDWERQQRVRGIGPSSSPIHRERGSSSTFSRLLRPKRAVAVDMSKS